MNIHEIFERVKHCGQSIRSRRTTPLVTVANQYICYEADKNSVCYLLPPAMTLTFEWDD